MEKALVVNSVAIWLSNGGTISCDGAVDITFYPTGHTTFKLQGSPDGVIAYADVAGTSLGTYSAGSPVALSVFRPLSNVTNLSGLTYSDVKTGIGYLKVVIDAGSCLVIKRRRRNAPPPVSGVWALPTGSKQAIDPQYGTP